MELEAMTWGERSASLTKLAAAVSKFQVAIEPAKKEAANPYFKSKYADLSAVWAAIRDPLAANELAILQEPSAHEGKVVVTTTLLHSSGEYVRSSLTVPVLKQDAQGYGSAITYARRYALQSITGVAPEDDDGNSAGQAPEENKQRAKYPQVKPADQIPAKPKAEVNDGKKHYYSIALVEDRKQADAIEWFETHGAGLDVESNLYVSIGKIPGCDKFEVTAPMKEEDELPDSFKTFEPTKKGRKSLGKEDEPNGQGTTERVESITK